MAEQAGCELMKLNIRKLGAYFSVGLFEGVVAFLCIFLMVLHKNKRKYAKYMALLFGISRFFPDIKLTSVNKTQNP
jgi:hypothetical protein